MFYQLPPLLDDDEFERLVRDITRRVYDDPGIERFGRKGQSQSGIDGLSPDSTSTFQCKLKDTRYETADHKFSRYSQRRRLDSSSAAGSLE